MFFILKNCMLRMIYYIAIDGLDVYKSSDLVLLLCRSVLC